MGTNYYWHPKEKCPHCEREYEPIHIGKSSAGWCFGLHVYPKDEWQEDAEVIESLDDWEKLWERDGTYIEDEYGRAVTPTEMGECIAERRRETPPEWTYREYQENHAELGPKNMIRHCIESGHCIGHGAGTWDLIIGIFS